MSIRKLVEYFEVDEDKCRVEGTHYLFKDKLHISPCTKATEFLVFEDLAVSPSADWSLGRLTGGTDIYVGFMINCTEYYYTPTTTGRAPGIRGLDSPFPEIPCAKKKFFMRPRIPVLSGQGFEIVLYHKPLNFDKDCPEKKIIVSAQYLSMDGTDAVIATKLYESHVPVTLSTLGQYITAIHKGRSGGGDVISEIDVTEDTPEELKSVIAGIMDDKLKGFEKRIVDALNQPINFE